MMLYSHLKDDLYPVLRARFSSVEEAREWSEACWAEFEALLDADKPDVTIISSEHFANIGDPTEFIDRLRQRFDRIDFVAYARDPVAIYVSNVDELVRGGVRFADLPQLNQFQFNSVTNIRKFEPLLGTMHIHLRNFSRECLVGGDVVDDFFDVLSNLTGKTLVPQSKPATTNESICGAATAWILTMNETFVFQSVDTRDRNVIRERQILIDRMRASEALAGMPRLSLKAAPDLEAVIRHRSAPTVAWLNDTYLSEADQIQTVEPLDDIPGQKELRRRLRNWFFGYLTPDAVKILMREVVPLYRLSES
ncbi:MAG: hypothetical protein AAFR47_07420 [Pseudomonadota bacterium]